MSLANWTCPLEYFNDGFSCDCNCGLPDPDCLDPLKPLYNCGLEEICSTDGVCVGGVPNIPIPDLWECDPTWWNVRDGCDCECGEGARDPDCDFEGTLWNCDEATQFCNDLGLCEDKSFSPTSAPTGPVVTMFPTASPIVPGWTCPSGYFNDGHACDCNCGVADPDCLKASNPLYNCGLEQTCSPEGVCVGGVPNIPIPELWECDPTWWNVRDGCDCECGEGARDPDCDFEGTLWNCDEATQFCNDLGLCEDKSFSPTSAPTGPFVTKFPTSSPTVEAEASTQNLFLAVAGALLSIVLVLLLVALYCATKKNTTGVKEYIPETKKNLASEEKKADVMAFGSGPTL